MLEKARQAGVALHAVPVCASPWYYAALHGSLTNKRTDTKSPYYITDCLTGNCETQTYIDCATLESSMAAIQ